MAFRHLYGMTSEGIHLLNLLQLFLDGVRWAPSLNLARRGSNGARTAFPAVRAHGLWCAGLPARIRLGADWHPAGHASADSRY